MALSVWVQAAESGVIALLPGPPAVVEFGARIIAPKSGFIHPGYGDIARYKPREPALSETNR
ncbi:hypothetical protein A3754_14005 [Alcanivorax sp. HI0083]|jgi:hypothetical protein|uniref:hypothetical protein n=1 Tax=unclassified Alcanivorax TaxID=2638842 RepID=UPI0007B8F34D|nr:MULTISPECIES: hypothetical protein [unclassified Alcanivorax]KZY28676.1 hypothetical protein A3730_08060 [Alcanivorax sp. HI0044]KZY39987.1 hypothetical protein A3730_23010 [Alcanivorax sp. HI0044]KZZ25574.1 hypothetical protein A3754_14005 [Alcanivorax sp. HI0083]PHR68350.1 MAG: hypothetical protein COA55_01815 [Alcanivorax sp.]